MSAESEFTRDKEIKQIQMMDQHRLTKTDTQILKYKLYMSHKNNTINLLNH